MPFYAVAKGRIPGVYKSWDECKEQIDKFPGAVFKKFLSESQCIQFISEKSVGSNSTSRSSASADQSSGNSLKTINNTAGSLSTANSKRQSSPRFNAPQQGPSNEDASSDTVDRAFLANLGRGLKRASTEHHDTRKTKLGRFAFDMDESGFVQVYTDGSCVNNGKVGARAGLGVYWGENHPLNISEPVRGLATNNAGEIQAAIEAIKVAKEQAVKKLCINTDSQFVVLSITMWVPNWKRKNWKLADGGRVKNATDFKELDRLYNDDSMEIKWNYIKAHTGNLGNERADQLAKGGAARYRFATHYNR